MSSESNTDGSVPFSLLRPHSQVFSQLAFLHSSFGEWTDGFIALQTTLNQVSVPLRSFNLSSIPTELKFRSIGSLAAPPAWSPSSFVSQRVEDMKHSIELELGRDEWDEWGGSIVDLDGVEERSKHVTLNTP
ncbi:hypothetical protein BLNAU_12117 [Blattamonas nauphoetae]|uniref:Uncharacterized protein n=1 Tax=Blattamonas nauphoetae TaxID=2049346 RepID=A0ABQ9XKI4_9EUKA|nr:hypothetical protein BLNAU_12117 [Blattamonas nauphoetae]